MVRIHALDLPTHTATALVAIEPPFSAWNKTMNPLPKMQIATPAEVQAALDRQPVSLPAGAWVVRRAENGWRTDDLQPADALRVSRILGWLAALEVGEDVLWTKADGFQPRAGALGLLIPAADYTLRWDDGAVRRVVVGARTPMGRGVWLFDNLDVDQWGNPHPTGLYVAKE